MRKMTWTIVGFVLLVSGLWLITGWTSFKDPTFFGLRDGLVQWSGIIAIALMSISVLLAARPRWLEKFYNGLDKMYRLHKWVGITALFMCVFHWVEASGFKFLIQWGLMAGNARGASPGGFRGPGGGRPGAGIQGAQTLLQKLIGPAHWTSEWAFYALLIITAMAALTFVAYWLFAMFHRLEGIVYLVLVFHSVVLFKANWLSPIGILSALIMAVGTVYAILELFHLPTHFRRSRGEITAIREIPELDAIQLDIKIDGKWKGHQAGQFAFVKLARHEAPHPFTIASSWKRDGTITFIIKALGDFTKDIKASIEVGHKVKIEGPYGCFDFNDGKKRQIWIGAGIGVTPFIARLQQLDALDQGDRAKVDFYHSISSKTNQTNSSLYPNAEASGVKLSIWESGKRGRLNARKIMEEVPDWKEASVWFCGPSDFMKAIRREFLRKGLADADFHYELFEMR